MSCHCDLCNFATRNLEAELCWQDSEEGLYANLLQSTLEQKLSHCSLQVVGDKKFPMKYVEQEMSWS